VKAHRCPCFLQRHPLTPSMELPSSCSSQIWWYFLRRATASASFVERPMPGRSCRSSWGLLPWLSGRGDGFMLQGGEGIDSDGTCCSDPRGVDACGRCGGSSVAVDVLGTCCSAALPPSGLCCQPPAEMDSCGVCGGVNQCAALVSVSVSFRQDSSRIQCQPRHRRLSSSLKLLVSRATCCRPLLSSPSPIPRYESGSESPECLSFSHLGTCKRTETPSPACTVHHVTRTRRVPS
jgi:hypothetical protein